MKNKIAWAILFRDEIFSAFQLVWHTEMAMDQKLLDILAELKKRGLTSEQEEKILAEIRFEGAHGVSKDTVVREPGGNAKV